MFTQTMDISTSGLMAQRARIMAIAGNLANITSTRNENGELKPYEPRFVVFQADDSIGANNAAGVRVAAVGRDTHLPPVRKYDPQHPDADKDGFINLPRINMMTEFTNAVEASRSYEANLGAIEISKSMANQTLRIIT
ncbi:MAG: flagellar basal body rod protein FlgC [Planctomycetaceae bacterium]|nr:flagellar basal body rod protein FlgC [Planctomycetaceae bacterium]